ncbi:LacI family DNA-binding transcriptional regulator [Cellulomonas sp. Root137]|uniref:LacI family DNA-binding transcriptional regulator n=1 Tax=Cellulomonas sp. Root137 TaxID=1736459 RepID=UPI00190FE887|nr:LacI family DNA-binding transcriptional regulator [Cellulomonas sp. Root137]
MPRVTLKDIAREAGVSVMTVSNVVNGNLGRVSPATAATVERIVEERGYVPSGAAQSLAAGRTRLVGLLLPARQDGTALLGSPHDVSVAGALEAALRERDHHLMLRAVENTREVQDSVQRWNLDGVVVMGFTDDELRALDIPDDVPAVVVDASVGDGHAGAVRADDIDGGRLAGEHLAALGHRRVVFCGPVDARSQVVTGRLDGLRDALGADPVTVAANTTYEDGLAAGERIAREHPDATAVFATADVLAAGIQAGLIRAGHRVPTDVSVLGFDDADIARYVSPCLSTIRQDTAGKGRAAAELLLQLIEGADLRASRPDGTVHIGVELVVRESTGPASVD